MKLVIYTAIFDIRDSLYSVPDLGPDVAYHCYTDTVTEPIQMPGGWLALPPVWKHPTRPRLRARRHKLLSHMLYPYAQATLWVDGCLTPEFTDVDSFLEEHYHDLFTFRHMQRNCIYQEMDACIQLQKDSPEIIERLRQRYRAEGYPAKRGLAETTAVLRRNTPAMAAFNEHWWQELSRNSIRDQLSFDYVCWKRNQDYGIFAGKRTESPLFTWRPHR